MKNIMMPNAVHAVFRGIVYPILNVVFLVLLGAALFGGIEWLQLLMAAGVMVGFALVEGIIIGIWIRWIMGD